MTQLTKLALEQALKEALLHKPLDKIKISDITDACGVSRMTFYYHFKDIYDLVEWSCEHDAALALKGRKTYATWQDGLLGILEEVRRNKPFIVNVYHSTSMNQILGYLNRITESLLEAVVEEASEGHKISPSDQTFIARFYTHAFVGIILDWVRADLKEDPKTLSARIALVVKGNIPAAIERFSSI